MMSVLGNVFGAAAVLLFYALRWTAANMRFVVPVVIGLWGLFLLSELRRGFEHVSAQLASVNARLEALRDAAVERSGYLKAIRDQLQEIRDDTPAIEAQLQEIRDYAREVEQRLESVNNR